jgi:pSer/pThr/pTyr-binding forkhead associated (FHA) protein
MPNTNNHETEISVNLSPEPILVVTDNNGTRKIILAENQYTIGRELDNTIHLDSDFVSRHHAYLLKVSTPDHRDTFRIIDGSIAGKPSKNGLLVNAIHSVRSYELQDGDIVTFAPEVHILYLAATKS